MSKIILLLLTLISLNACATGATGADRGKGAFVIVFVRMAPKIKPLSDALKACMAEQKSEPTPILFITEMKKEYASINLYSKSTKAVLCAEKTSPLKKSVESELTAISTYSIEYFGDTESVKLYGDITDPTSWIAADDTKIILYVRDYGH